MTQVIRGPVIPKLVDEITTLEARVALLESLLREAEAWCPMRRFGAGPPLLADRIEEALTKAKEAADA